MPAITGVNITQIAVVCHEANRAYCVTIGDNSQQPWSESPEWQRKSAIDGVVFHLDALSQGRDVPPSASHDGWLEAKRLDGWKYGPVKDAAAKTHPCFVAYDELPLEQKLKDYIFGGIVKAVYAAATQKDTIA